jgi:tyrosyl-tRNA synthetase
MAGFKYNIEELRNAIVSNTKEVLPNLESLDKELVKIIEKANNQIDTEGSIRHYIGFEISGLVHIGTGIMSALRVRDLSKAGVKCHIYLADYHTYINKKLDGKLETIERVRKEYFEPTMRKCMELVGCKMENVVFISALESYKEDFWHLDLNVANNLTLSRVLKSISITGKKEGEDVNFSVLRYPVMQVADPFYFNIHIVQAGMDQRKAHVLMREVAYKLDVKNQIDINGLKVKPIAIHHNLLLGLGKPNPEDLEGSKMSKSKPDTALFVHDSIEEINRKFKKAFCPIIDVSQTAEENIKLQELNPILDWCKNMIFPAGLNISIDNSKNLNNNQKYIEYSSFEALFSDYLKNKIHPSDLKQGVANCLIEWFSPIRKWVENSPSNLNLVKEIVELKKAK